MLITLPSVLVFLCAVIGFAGLIIHLFHRSFFWERFAIPPFHDRDDPEFARYCKEMRTLENIAFRIAYEEGSVTAKRVFELVPEIKECKECKARVRKIIGFDAQSAFKKNPDGSYSLRPHQQNMLKAVDQLGEQFSDYLPADQVRYEHDGCHAVKQASP